MNTEEEQDDESAALPNCLDEPRFADPNDRLDHGQTEGQWEWAHGPGIR